MHYIWGNIKLDLVEKKQREEAFLMCIEDSN